jgi:hypothetical protein
MEKIGRHLMTNFVKVMLPANERCRAIHPASLVLTFSIRYLKSPLLGALPKDSIPSPKVSSEVINLYKTKDSIPDEKWYDMDKNNNLYRFQ